MPVSGSPFRRTLLVALGLSIGTLLLFARSTTFGFLDYDDPRYILENAAIQAGFDRESLAWAFTGHGDIWNPLVRLTHILDLQLFGLQAAGHHLHNILWHAANAALAFLLLRRLTGAFWTSAVCAALFAWHPLRVESVTWISERKDVVSVCFGLLTLLAYTAYAERRAAGARARREYCITLLAFVGALLSKPSMVVLPGVFLLLDCWPLGRWRLSPAAPTGRTSRPETTSRLLLEKVPFAVLAAVLAYVTIHTQTSTGSFVLELPLSARLANALVTLPRYVGMFFWPFNLSTTYSHPGWWPAPVVSAAALAVAGDGAVSWFQRRTMPWIAVGCLWYVGTLLPMIGLVQVGFQSMADRYTYLPLLGWQLALLWSIRALVTDRVPRWLPAAGASLMLLGCAARTWHQQGYWRDPLTLTRHGVAADPNDPVARGFLSYTLASAGQFAEARTEAERTLALAPRNAVALQVLAQLDAMDGHSESALARRRTLVAVEPNNPVHALGLANNLVRLQQFDEADALYRALHDHPTAGGEARLGSALIAGARHDAPAAVEILRAAHAAYPDYVPVLEHLSAHLHLTNRTDEADALFARALARRPRDAELLRAHSALLRAAGRTDEALAALGRAIARRPHDPALREERALLLASSGRTSEAMTALAALMDQFPEYAPAPYHLGALHEQSGAGERAAELYRRAAALSPALVPAQLALARLAEARSDTAETDAIFTRAIAAAPRAAELPRAYAEILARRRQFAAAIPYFRRAIELAPADAATHTGLGFMLLITDQREAALAAWAEALRLQPDFPALRERYEQLRAGR